MTESSDELQRVPDDDLDFDEDLVFFHDGALFTGVAFSTGPMGERSELQYLNGMQEGPARDWFENGTLEWEGFFHLNVRHGPSREYDRSGRLLREETYEFGVRTRAVSLDEFGREKIEFILTENDPNFKILRDKRTGVSKD